MKPHLRYLSYVVRHKWFVFLAGLKTKAPLWRLVIHDWSKFTPAEWRPYVQTFYGSELWKDSGSIQKQKNRFDRAWLHHQHRNPHHWQHWLLREDDGNLKTLDMPTKLVCEMVADWMGAGRAITGRWEVGSWFEANAHKIKLHPDALIQVENLIDDMRDRGIA